MKVKALSIVMMFLIMAGLVATTSPVQAAGYGTNFVTSITYMNIGSASAAISVNFYKEGVATVDRSYSVTDLAAGAAASLGVGSVYASGSFKGSAVMSSSQPLIATMVQVPQSTDVKNRPLSNGYKAGSTDVLVPTVIKGNTNSIFSIQNAGTTAVEVKVHFIPIDANSGTDYTATIVSLAPGAAQYYDMGTFTAADNTNHQFNGSARVTATEPMVVSVIEAGTASSNNSVYSFEAAGSTDSAQTLYMPSAMCKLSNAQTSYYAIVNTAAAGNATDITVQFKGYINNATKDPVDQAVHVTNLDGGKKVSVPGCGLGTETIPDNFIGSATITSSAQPIVGMAKILGPGWTAAHSGTTVGASRIAAPYVRFSNKWWAWNGAVSVQRSYLAIQNVGNPLDAGAVTVKFVGPDGTVQGTYVYNSALATGAKFSVTPADAGLPEFGYVADATTGKPKSYGGGVIIEGPSTSLLAAVVRVQTDTSLGFVAEDYNAMAAPLTTP